MFTMLLLLFCVLLVSIDLELRVAEASAECDQAKADCHADTDCLHRIIYLHSTCITGSCQSQCKAAVLNLYDQKFGRTLLETDLSCMSQQVMDELKNCNLLLTDSSSSLHCTLALAKCRSAKNCRAKLDVYESECMNLSSGQCPEECANYYAKVLVQSDGKALQTCVCWKQDPLCKHLKQTVLDFCVSQANALLSQSVQSESDGNDRGGSGIVLSNFWWVLLSCSAVLLIGTII